MENAEVAILGFRKPRVSLRSHGTPHGHTGAGGRGRMTDGEKKQTGGFFGPPVVLHGLQQSTTDRNWK